MALTRIVVQNGKGEKRIVQPAMIPAGFKYVGPYDPVQEAKKKEAAAQSAKTNAGGVNGGTNAQGQSQGTAGNK